MELEEVLRANSKLKGFVQHGVLFTSTSGNQIVGTCPFCHKARKFYAHCETRAWDCKRCGESGGFQKFLMLCAKQNASALKGKSLSRLTRDRGLSKDTLRAWRVGWDNEIYTIPVDSLGKIVDLRRYSIGKKIISTSGGKAGLAGVTSDSDNVWLCEGEWDAMTCFEILTKIRRSESVYGVSGAMAFPSEAASLFQGKNVFVVFDNDDAGIRGEQKVFNILSGVAKRINFVHWPKSFPEGFDLRNLYQQEDSSGRKTFKMLKQLLNENPRSTDLQKAETKNQDEAIELTGKGLSPRRVSLGYKKWLHLPNTEVLSILYGAILANRLEGDPLWMFIVAPPGGTKSEILMSLEDAPLIVPTSSLTPQALVSGANFAVGGDPSLIPKLDGKILVIKDFTVILNMNFTARDEIFGILRDAYDGHIEKFFGNGVFRQFRSKFGIIAGVTPIIETFSNLNSVLGERFIRYKIKRTGKINVGKDMIEKAISNINKENTMRDHLKGISYKVLDRTIDPKEIPKIEKKTVARLIGLAQWLAALRGVVAHEKYTGEIQFKPTAEIGTRLGKQLCKLAIGISLYKREDHISSDTFQSIITVARDTAPDRVEEVVKQLYLQEEDEFISTKTVAEWTRFPVSTLNRILQDLNLLHVVQRETGVAGYWKLGPSIRKLMDDTGVYEKEKSWKSRRKKKGGKND